MKPIHGQECGSEQFYCEKSDPPICIRLDQVCDGIPDCEYEENTFEYEYEADYTALGTIFKYYIIKMLILLYPFYSNEGDLMVLINQKCNLHAENQLRLVLAPKVFALMCQIVSLIMMP